MIESCTSNTNNQATISLEELAQHGTQDDAWIALKGHVYDVTFFLKEHPGGLAPILKYVGKDGTHAFNSVHAYVDFKSMLKEHHKGFLPGEEGRKAKISFQNKSAPGCCSCFKIRDKRLPVQDLFYENKKSVLYEIKFSKKTISCEADWAAGVEVGEHSVLRVHKFLDNNNVWVSSHLLKHPIAGLEMAFAHDNTDFNSCIITLIKTKDEDQTTWESLGEENEENNSIIDSMVSTEMQQAHIVYKQAITDDVNLYGIRLRRGVFGVHIGHHIHIQVIGGADVQRPYTPVCYSIIPKNPPSNLPGKGPIVWFIIKTYSDGALTSRLNQVPVSKSEKDKGASSIKMSFPAGIFDTKFIFQEDADLLLLFAGGTGITPMTRILQHVLLKGADRGKKKVVLFFWNKLESDIILRDQFEELKRKESSWFKFVPILTRAPATSWKGYVGRPSVFLMKTMMDDLPQSFSNAKGKHAAVCGSTGFNESIERSTSNVFPKDKLFVFEG